MQLLQKPKQGYKLVKSLFGKYEIPEEWKLEKLGSHSTLFVPMRNKPKKFGGVIDWLRIEDFDGKYVSYSKSNQKVSLATIKEMKLRVYPIGTVLCSCSATIGAYAITGKELITNQTFIGIYPHKDLDKEFLYYYLNTQTKNLIKIGSGTTILYISREKFEDFPIIMPPLNEQQKISSILSNVDSMIQQTQKIIEQTQRLKKGLMQKLLTKGIGHIKFKKIKWNYGKLLEIPENWNVVLLDKVSKRGSGHTPDVKIPEYYNGGIKWISLADSRKLDNVYISETEKEISEKGIENSSAIRHPAGIVVLSRDAGIGKSAITTTEMAVSQHFMAWKCGDELNNHFLYYLLQFWKPLFEDIANGTTIKTIGLSFFKKFKIILPSRKEQDKIALILLNIDKSLWKLQELKSNLENLKKSLMQKLLTGQIRVKV
ncbi:MAG: restriction endonuclease subunit S [Nitrosotalea sp.]